MCSFVPREGPRSITSANADAPTGPPLFWRIVEMSTRLRGPWSASTRPGASPCPSPAACRTSIQQMHRLLTLVAACLDANAKDAAFGRPGLHSSYSRVPLPAARLCGVNFSRTHSQMQLDLVSPWHPGTREPVRTWIDAAAWIHSVYTLTPFVAATTCAVRFPPMSAHGPTD
jgi:hypothetical protein